MERLNNSNHEKAEASGRVLESFGEILPSNMEKVMETPKKDDDNVLRTQNLVPIARDNETHEQTLPPFQSLSTNLIPPFEPQPLVVQSTFDNNKNTHKFPKKKTDKILDCHPYVTSPKDLQRN
ncbi:hypothetical protein CTI12_AA153540 [Artemisia annua]|uniref:Uncharacterized protein n=1 Tax=Artemisia annua TaxID=35608 RepID=A0A2U1PH71_ARTAN|nr:hypothetical protein CTI12_AA153540 [Artemisia annua]